MRTYNWGKFLSSGACKDVYMVKNNSTGTLDAVSVMDIGDLEERGMELAIKQEIEVKLDPTFIQSVLYDYLSLLPSHFFSFFLSFFLPSFLPSFLSPYQTNE